MSITTALDALIDRYVGLYAEHNKPLLVERQDDWDAPIYREPWDHDPDYVIWQPVQQTHPLNFKDLAAALEMPFQSDFADYYSRWFAGDLAVDWNHHPLQLLHIHCSEDGERLLANCAGHILMKRRLKQSPSLFIGLAEEADDLLLTVDNETGVVGLEWVGQGQHEVLADSLEAFIQEVTPRLQSHGEES
ncbi:MAG TPA: SecY-interacting protein [Pseudidiomarina sp.]|nr:SecY-interacting protein [Pseudidiomarina sp.]